MVGTYYGQRGTCICRVLGVVKKLQVEGWWMEKCWDIYVTRALLLLIKYDCRTIPFLISRKRSKVPWGGADVTIFFIMEPDVQYHPAKFEIKKLILCMEKKKDKLYDRVE